MTVPAHWKKTSARPDVVDGYEFLAYRVAIDHYVRHCVDLNVTVRTAYRHTGYFAQVAGVTIKSPRTGKAHKFRDRKNAYRAGIKAAKERKTS